MNQFNSFNWDKLLSLYPENSSFNVTEYYNILCPDFPYFLKNYIETPSLQRLMGIGLLCGTDYTYLYKNRFYYSRLDHSIAVALIIWNFTKDKKQCIAGLLHDISTPIFSHVIDFCKGDTLTQTFTEKSTEDFIKNDTILCSLLKQDNIQIEEVSNYHIYTIADNEIPQLSADRLEYMFPSGAALIGNWTLEEIKTIYNNIIVLKNEDGKDELGFSSIEIAKLYTYKFCQIGHILQLNENKLTLQLLSEIVNTAINLKILNENDFYSLSEKDAMNIFLDYALLKPESEFSKLFFTFIRMDKVYHSYFPKKNCFNVNIKVKQRYINPLVKDSDNNIYRITDISYSSKKLIKDFLSYNDTPYGCVKLFS